MDGILILGESGLYWVLQWIFRKTCFHSRQSWMQCFIGVVRSTSLRFRYTSQGGNKQKKCEPPKKSDVSRIFIFSGQTKNVDLLDLETKPLKKESKKQLFQGLMRWDEVVNEILKLWISGGVISWGDYSTWRAGQQSALWAGTTFVSDWTCTVICLSKT